MHLIIFNTLVSRITVVEALLVLCTLDGRRRLRAPILETCLLTKLRFLNASKVSSSLPRLDAFTRLVEDFPIIWSVAYTQLTLPTNREVQISGVGGS